MAGDSPAPDAAVKPKRIRGHAKEYKARTETQKNLHSQNRKRKKKVVDAGEIEPPPAGEEEQHYHLRLLEKRTRSNPTDADGDIDFAYRNMALPSVTPLMALSVPPTAGDRHANRTHFGAENGPTWETI